MSLTMSAAVDADRAAVVLTIESSGILTEVVRADANGTRTVRYPGGAPPRDGTSTLTDFEPALSGWVQYRARKLGNEEASVWVDLGALLPRFSLPTVPPNSVEVLTVTDYAAARTGRSTFHEVIGRNDHAVNLGGLTPRSGTLEILFPSFAHGRDLEALLERGETVFYRQSEHLGMDMYFIPTGLSWARDGRKWKLSVQYTETEFLWSGVEDLTGWTFDALRNGNLSFNAVARDYDDFARVLTGTEDTP